ncbi:MULTISPECIES: co-regulatory protein PtrA N-terminal domain-containing protein [Pseudomonadaceae]|uniref:DUF2790 domain-containing protein n=1 Tax=Pseudomonas denitrificans TaxID=43306 RepID=A0A9X7N0C7_PSEDE|nr:MULTISPECIES: DUF2790 domain-containing protein [Pseudomonadaceae]MBD9500801.1 DUF2790 domain-containing protein [Pseudomonas sp. PDM17]MBD9517613.1 DUF2790 domain-containing protein [Pseudomonas sp. PDM22]OQR36451.1 hypothetical protein BWR15_09010 [Pseudomonas sp. T]QEY71405.1 DUF2790 domain-containing protein [Pseudomonas denitrificans (nom. rej.)]
MKLSRIFLTAALLGASSLALADGGGDITFARMEQARQQVMQARQGAPSPTQIAEAKQYTYGMNLDIAEVVAVTPMSSDCGVVPVQLRYKDSFGDEQAIEYRTERVACRATR